MAYTTRIEIPVEQTEYYDRSLLERALPLLLHTKFGQVRDIPRKEGTNTIKFRRYGSLTAATTALTEGTTPAGSQLSVTDMTADVLQYGDYVTITDKVDYESQDPVLTEAAQILGDQAGDTIDQLCRDVLAAGTTVQYCDSRSARLQMLASSIVSTTDLRKAVRTLKGNNAKRITTMVNPDTGYNTSPINACFIALIHPNVSYDVENLTGFIKVEQYANKTEILPGEIGTYNRVRFLETTNAKSWAIVNGPASTALTVYGNLIIGANAYGITRISGEAMRNIVKPLGSAGSADPLDQRQTSGWKATFVAKILNENFMLRLESTATA